MKKIVLYSEKIIFKSIGSIRSKRDSIILLLETVKYLMIYYEKIVEFSDVDVVENDDDITIVLYIDKMKRIFYCTKDKVQSLCFPFNIKLDSEDRELEIYYNYSKIDLKCISTLLSLFNNESLNNSLELVYSLFSDESYINSSEDYKKILEELIHFLYMYEDGYLRFDFDDFENEDVDYHPRHHIDLFYTNSNTFKLGIKDKISLKNIIKIIDINQKCLNIN